MASTLEYLEWRQVSERAINAYWDKKAEIDEIWEKAGYSPPVERLAELLNLVPGEYVKGIPNSPAPLTSMLTGGLAGAGLGYMAGAGIGWMMPRKWKKERLRRTAAAIGGMMGASPGLLWGGINKADGRSFNDSSLFQQKGFISPTQRQQMSVGKTAMDQLVKEAAFSPTGLGSKFPALNRDAFNRIIWQDPGVAPFLSPQIQAGASGLIDGAAHLSRRSGTRFVTPMDIGRVAAGMGSGYLAGAMVGKALSLAFGAPPAVEKKLRDTGVLAGIIANVVPIAFGG